MSSEKILQMPVASSLTGAENVPIVQGFLNKRVTLGQIAQFVLTQRSFGTFTVSTLPAPSSALNGFRAYVTDSTLAFSSANIGSSPSGSGSNGTPVVIVNGAWVIG